MLNELNKKDIYIPLEIAEAELSKEVSKNNLLVDTINRMRRDILAIYPKQILVVSNQPFQMYSAGQVTELNSDGIRLYTGDLVKLPASELGIIVVEINTENENPFSYFVQTKDSKIRLVQDQSSDDFGVGVLDCSGVHLVKMVNDFSPNEVLVTDGGFTYTVYMQDHEIKSDLFMDLQIQRGF